MVIPIFGRLWPVIAQNVLQMAGFAFGTEIALSESVRDQDAYERLTSGCLAFRRFQEQRVEEAPYERGFPHRTSFLRVSSPGKSFWRPATGC
jgi:hypothetical protein